VLLVSAVFAACIYMPASATAQSNLDVTVTVLPPGDYLAISPLRIGDVIASPQETDVPVLAFRFDNFMASAKSVSELAVRHVSQGSGSPAQLRSNIDSVSLYRDVDEDLAVSGGDILLGTVIPVTDSLAFTFAPIVMQPDSGVTFLVAAHATLFPRDGDSLDFAIQTATDIKTTDSLVPLGPAIVNSTGYGLVDGMLAAQAPVIAAGSGMITPADSFYSVMTLDLPRNGYAEDTLQIISFANLGTAPVANTDSLVLFADDGNGSWGGPSEETRLGHLEFTGGLWSISGLTWPLATPANRIHLGVRLAEYPTDGATLQFAVPTDGIQVTSGNDGPLDAALVSPDTFSIQSLEAILVSAVPVPSRSLIPGTQSQPLLSLQLRNSYAADRTVDSLRIAWVAVDPDGASQAELDSQLDSLLVYLDGDGDPAVTSGADLLLGTGYVTNGIAVLPTGGLSIPAGGQAVYLSLATALSASAAKNGNTVGLELQDSTDVFATPAATVGGTFPLVNANSHTVNAFPAALIALTTIPGATSLGGDINIEIFRCVLPPNGYAQDSLRSFRLTGSGSFADAGSHITLKLWYDVTGNGFTGDDLQLGTLAYNAPNWDLVNLSFPVGAGGLPICITMDVASTQFDGGTRVFEIPVGGITYASGTSGPDDVPSGTLEEQLILPTDRVTLVSAPSPGTAIAPGSPSVTLLAFALYNGYLGQTKVLTDLRLTNTTKTASTAAFADSEVGQVALYLDTNGNRVLDNDSLLGTGYFSAGALQFSGLGAAIAPESLAFLFAVADVSLSAIDSDSLDVSIQSPADVGFADATVTNGDLPLGGGSYLVIDGSIQKQYQVQSLSSRSVRPGDTDLTVMAFRPAANGDLVDTLQSLTIENLQTATSADLASLELWLDLNADNIWQSSDSLLGLLAFTGAAWQISGLTVEVAGSAPTLLVQADIAPAALPGRVFEASVPLLGCQYASDNDGPVDIPLGSRAEFAISGSAMRIAQSPLQSSYSVGQIIAVEATVTNALLGNLDSVLGALLYLDNPTTVTFDSATAGPVNLAAGDSAVFTWWYTASQPGTTYWRLRAEAPLLPDSSPVVQTAITTIQAPSSPVFVQFINSIPTAVTRGQANVFPLSIKYAHPNTVPTAASVQLDSLLIRVEDGASTPIPANTAFSRMVLSSGSQPVTIVTSVPSASDVWLVFSNPVVVTPGETKTYSLLVDVDSSATANTFSLALTTPASVPLVDANSQQPVAIDPGVAFPLSTAACRIDDASRSMAVSYAPLVGPAVNYGQQNVSLMRVYLRHPGAPGESQIQLSSIRVNFQDGVLTDLKPSELFTNVRLTQQGMEIGQLQASYFDSTVAEIALNLPITLSPGQVDSLDVTVNMLATSLEPGFQGLISDSTAFAIRDLASGQPLDVGSDTILSTGVVFPMMSGWTTLLQPALQPEICISSALPASIIGGVDSLGLIDFVMVQAGSPGYAGTRIHTIEVTARDSAGTILDPTLLFDQLGVSLTSGTVSYQVFVNVFAGAARFDLTGTGLLLLPGDTLNFTLVADIEADVPYSYFKLQIAATTSILLQDAVDSNHVPVLVALSGCGTGFPFETAYTQVFFPAGRPLVTPAIPGLRLAFPGQPGVGVFQGTLGYVNATPQSDLGVRQVTGTFWQRTANGLVSAAPASVFSSLNLSIAGTTVATDSSLNADSVVFALPTDYILSTGAQVDVRIDGDIRADAALGNYVIQLADSTFMSVVDVSRATSVFPLLAGNYPVWSAELSVAKGELETSFSNFPNPFIPSRGEITTLAYVLSEDATLNIEVYATTGQAVATLADNLFRAAGSYTDLVWSGQNDAGHEVAPGAYLCRIRATYSSGRTEQFTRKIAVLR
jgi:hypothetical protein